MKIGAAARSIIEVGVNSTRQGARRAEGSPTCGPLSKLASLQLFEFDDEPTSIVQRKSLGYGRLASGVRAGTIAPGVVVRVGRAL
jgi:hypothetical protein